MQKSASYVLSAYSDILFQSNDNNLDVGYQSKEGSPIINSVIR